MQLAQPAVPVEVAQNLGLSTSEFYRWDLEEEYQLQQHIAGLIQNRLIRSAHDGSEGGLFVTLVESAMPQQIGFSIRTADDIRKDAYLFGESQSRLVNYFEDKGINFTKLGPI